MVALRSPALWVNRISNCPSGQPLGMSRDLLSILSFAFYWVIYVHRVPIPARAWTGRRREGHLRRVAFAQFGFPLLLQNVLQRGVELLVVRHLLSSLHLGLGRQLDEFGVKGGQDGCSRIRPVLDLPLCGRAGHEARLTKREGQPKHLQFYPELDPVPSYTLLQIADPSGRVYLE